MMFNFNFNQNKPPKGKTKEPIEYTPAMEYYLKYYPQKLQCSIDRGDDPVPKGAKDFFDRHGYLIIKNLYDPEELFDLVPSERGQINYYGSIDKYESVPDERQVPGSLARYTHPKYKEVHLKIRLILEDILGEKLYNTYYYDRFYFAGQKLDRHSDRDSCEISVSVQISTNSTRPWPFCVETPNNQEHAVIIGNGSGVLYKGCERQHWRDSLSSRYGRFQRFMNKLKKKNDDTYHHQIFFHYVRANGPRSHFANDSGN